MILKYIFGMCLGRNNLEMCEKDFIFWNIQIFHGLQFSLEKYFI